MPSKKKSIQTTLKHNDENAWTTIGRAKRQPKELLQEPIEKKKADTKSTPPRQITQPSVKQHPLHIPLPDSPSSSSTETSVAERRLIKAINKLKNPKPSIVPLTKNFPTLHTSNRLDKSQTSDTIEVDDSKSCVITSSDTTLYERNSPSIQKKMDIEIEVNTTIIEPNMTTNYKADVEQLEKKTMTLISANSKIFLASTTPLIGHQVLRPITYNANTRILTQLTYL
jgi:hypothetical protein